MFEIVGREEQEFNQWEQGVKLSNPCMKAGDEVVFRNSSGATYVMIAGSAGVEVPNKLLQMTCNILVDLKQGSEQHDDCQTVFEVNPADKPDDYVYVDNTIRKQEVQSGGGAGGAGKFIVNATMDESYINFTTDKTYAEVASAIESGMDVVCHVQYGDGAFCVSSLVYYEPEHQITFTDVTNIGIESLLMFSDDTNEYHFTDLGSNGGGK